MVAQNAIIYASDYNSIQSTVAGVLGTGSNTLGYGQTPTSAQVTSGTLISDQPTPTAYQWAALYADMVKIANHQGTSITSFTSTYAANVAPGKLIQASDVNLFSATASTLQSNALNYAAGDMTTTNGILTSQRTAAWGSGNGVVQHIFNVAFGSYDNIRFFFNSGGAITFGGTLAGYSVNAQTTNWYNLLTNMGTITYGATGATYSGTGGTAYTIAYGSLTSSAQTIFRAYGSQTGGLNIYTSNFYQISASISGSTMTFSVVFDDAYTARFSPQLVPDQIDGTLTSSIGLRKAGATYLTISRPVAGDFVTTTALTS